MFCVHRLRFPHPPAEAQPNICRFEVEELILIRKRPEVQYFRMRPVDEEGCFCTVFRRAGAGRLKVYGVPFITLLHHDWRKFCEKYCCIVPTINFTRRRL
jgi:hypothetical protein